MPDDKTRMDERYPSNSLTSRRSPSEMPGAEVQTKPGRSITGKAREPKKSVGAKFLESFFATSLQEIGRYLLYDVAIPLAKDSWLDMWSMLLNGDRMSSRFSRDRDRSSVRPSYDRYWEDRNRKDSRISSRSRDGRRDEPIRRNNGQYDLEFDTRAKAETVLKWLIEDLEEYDMVPVSRMYSYANLDYDYTMQRYGWGNLDSAEVIGIPGGFLLKMPRAIVMN